MNYKNAGFKTKQEAINKILEMLVANPGTAGLDGMCQIVVFGEMFNLKPLKKKKEYEA